MAWDREGNLWRIGPRRGTHPWIMGRRRHPRDRGLKKKRSDTQTDKHTESQTDGNGPWSTFASESLVNH